MAIHNITRQAQPAAVARSRRKWYVSGLVIRMVIALVISWLIVMAFFVTGVGSH